MLLMTVLSAIISSKLLAEFAKKALNWMGLEDAFRVSVPALNSTQDPSVMNVLLLERTA